MCLNHTFSVLNNTWVQACNEKLAQGFHQSAQKCRSYMIGLGTARGYTTEIWCGIKAQQQFSFANWRHHGTWIGFSSWIESIAKTCLRYQCHIKQHHDFSNIPLYFSWHHESAHWYCGRHDQMARDDWPERKLARLPTGQIKHWYHSHANRDNRKRNRTRNCGLFSSWMGRMISFKTWDSRWTWGIDCPACCYSCSMIGTTALNGWCFIEASR
jgi:hypothetical protein